MSAWKKMSAPAQREAQVRMQMQLFTKNQKDTQDSIENHT